MRRPLSLGDDDLELITDPGNEIQRREHAEALRVALADLPERQREAVVLRDLYGLRYGEVAKALGLSRPATEALLFRARRALRQRLRPVVTTAIVVPLSVQEGLAQALPGFTAASVGIGCCRSGGRRLAREAHRCADRRQGRDRRGGSSDRRSREHSRVGACEPRPSATHHRVQQSRARRDDRPVRLESGGAVGTRSSGRSGQGDDDAQGDDGTSSGSRRGRRWKRLEQQGLRRHWRRRRRLGRGQRRLERTRNRRRQRRRHVRERLGRGFGKWLGRRCDDLRRRRVVGIGRPGGRRAIVFAVRAPEMTPATRRAPHSAEQADESDSSGKGSGGDSGKDGSDGENGSSGKDSSSEHDGEPHE